MNHRRRVILQWAVLLTASAIIPKAAVAHPFHVTIAEAEWNAKTGRLEVALRVYPDDLETALRYREKKRIDLDRTKDIDRMILDYLKEAFVVQAGDGSKCKLKWVGKEVSLKSAWLYFEVPLPGGLGGARFENRVLFEVLSDQVNTVNLRQGRRRTTLSFTRDRPKSTVPTHEERRDDKN